MEREELKKAILCNSDTLEFAIDIIVRVYKFDFKSGVESIHQIMDLLETYFNAVNVATREKEKETLDTLYFDSQDIARLVTSINDLQKLVVGNSDDINRIDKQSRSILCKQ